MLIGGSRFGGNKMGGTRETKEVRTHSKQVVIQQRAPAEGWGMIRKKTATSGEGGKGGQFRE